MLDLLSLGGDGIGNLISLLTAELNTLKEKLTIFDEITPENIYEIVEICGVDTLGRLLLRPQ